MTAPKGRRGILSYIDFIEDVTTKKTSATVDDFDASIGTVVNVSRMSPKLLQTQPHIVENRGITMAPLFLSLTS